jgi:mono/diheme cytochrome c family protein
MTNRPFARLTFISLSIVAVVACSKSATMTPSTSPSPAPSTNTAMARPAAVTPAAIAMGDSIYHARGCRNCHGPDAKGRTNGPDLTSGKFLHMNGTFDDFVRIITNGIPLTAVKDTSHKRAMPARGGPPTPLTDDQIKGVAAYLWSLNHP